jgi:hypothetical protein
MSKEIAEPSSQSRKTSGWAVLIGAIIVTFLAVFYVSVGSEWFVDGQLRLCVPGDAQRDGWCKRELDRRRTAEEEAKRAEEADIAQQCIPNPPTESESARRPCGR